MSGDKALSGDSETKPLTGAPALSESKAQTAPRKVREAVILKVQNPQSYTTLTINEAAVYFEIRPRTIHRWLYEGKLRKGGRRGSITIDSVLRWQKQRSRKRRSKNRDSR